MGRVDAGYARTRCPQERADHPGIGAALGAVRMQDVGIEGAHLPRQAEGRGDIGRRDLPAHRDAPKAKCKLRRDPGEELFLVSAAGGRIADHADRMAGTRLCRGEVAERPFRHAPLARLALYFRHRRSASPQKIRSSTYMVSPGMTGSVMCWGPVSISPLELRVTLTAYWLARGVNPPAVATAVWMVVPAT